METLEAFADWTDLVWKSGVHAEYMDDRDVAIVALGLTGEAGEVVEYVKKYLRDGKNPREGDHKVEFGNELGDMLFYWTRLVRWAGYNPNEIIQMNIEKLNARHARLLKEREQQS